MPLPLPLAPDTKLRRDATAEALTAAGYPTSPATLATKATRGGGPPFRLFGRIPIYTWAEALAWAESRMSAPRRSTSEGDAQQTEADTSEQDRARGSTSGADASAPDVAAVILGERRAAAEQQAT